MSSFFNMGGFEVYVWTAYAITLTIFALNLGLALFEKRKTRQMIIDYLTHVKHHES